MVVRSIVEPSAFTKTGSNQSDQSQLIAPSGETTSTSSLAPFKSASIVAKRSLDSAVSTGLSARGLGAVLCEFGFADGAGFGAEVSASLGNFASRSTWISAVGTAVTSPGLGTRMRGLFGPLSSRLTFKSSSVSVSDLTPSFGTSTPAVQTIALSTSFRKSSTDQLRW